MSDARLPVHVLVVNYNSFDSLYDCLASIPLDEVASITVLDNQSTHAGYEDLQAWAQDRAKVTVALSDANVGFGAGVNEAFKISGAPADDAIWVLNPDTVVSSAAVSLLRSQITESPGHIISPVIMSGEDGSECWFGGGDLDTRRGVTVHWRSNPAPDMPLLIGCSFLTGAAMMMTVHTWQALGGFREDLFMYWEDADLSLRAHRSGVTLAISTGAVIWHAVGASSASRGKSQLWHYYLQRNRLVVCSQEHSLPSLVLGRGSVAVLRLLARAIREREHRVARTLASLRGIWSGLTQS